MTVIKTIRNNVLEALKTASTHAELERIKISYLGRSGFITELLRTLSTIPVQERKVFGESANQLKEEIALLIQSKINEIEVVKLKEKLAAEKIDVGLPGFPFLKGITHPLRKTLQDISSIFEAMGFEVALGPEIENEWYNFEALNIPKNHPARDTQDTFYLSGELEGQKRLLRTHTSPVQIRVMKEKKTPPIKIIAPGRVYRNEATDATHSAIFHQVEGLLVDENVTFADLKGVLTSFVRQFFSVSGYNVRFRPSHFQFTEPSAELDVQCIMCGGKGCRICKNEGWLEVLGCGMVHPNVLKAVNIDPEKYSGFAFGIGVERFCMLKYSIDDMRLLYENNYQFLKQFNKL
ncbi:MAG: phenylalanine--tRNA ligase subunit alpha [Endomicrobiales bacterium]|nr:phenylalanine--tRNA ligase subunit alpha [Endomicrobiales bacterium]